MKRIIKIIAFFMVMIFGLCGCGTETTFTSNTSPAGNIDSSDADNNSDDFVDGNTQSDESSRQRVKFTMDSGRSFIIELYPEYAPKTVENFVDLVSTGFYDGLTFHRIVDDFMAQGGDPNGNGTGGSPHKIKGEFSVNGFTQNTLSHTRGVVSMARSKNPNSASSQFFICYGDATFLDGQYAAFGKVIEGMEVVDSFLEVERVLGNDGAMSRPIDPIVIEKAEVL